MQFNKSLFQDRLHGYRLRLFSERPNSSRSVKLDFSLVDNQLPEIRDLFFLKMLKIKGAVIELSIIDYLEWIEQFFSISRNLDSYIQVAVREGGTNLLTVKIYQYQMALDKNEKEGLVFLTAKDNSCLSHEQVVQVDLMAMRLTQPEQQHIKLEPKQTENTETGSWLFNPEKRDSGP